MAYEVVKKLFHEILNNKEETMTVHLLVAQLRFARSEFVRCLDGVSEEEGRRRSCR